jgi:16S rRNA G966 N2-methylase RsmD
MDISQIRLNPNNPRTIRDEKFKKLCKSLKENPEFLDARPIVVKDNVIIGGNMRYRALLENKTEIKPEWIKDVTGWTDEAIRKFIVVDNIAYGDNDWDELANQYEKEELEDWGMDVDKWVDDEVVEDEVPEVTENPKSKLGEIYQLGRHIIMCGDSTKIEDVERLMDGKKADMVFTDPPYGMDLDVKNSDNLGGKDGWKNKAKHYSKVIGDDTDYNPTHLFEMFPDVKEMFLWGFDYYAEFIPNRKEGSVIVWDKRAGVEDMKLTFSEFELCWSKSKHLREVFRVTWSGLLGTEQEFDHKRYHPTQKPIKLSRLFVDKFSKENELIVDLFLGSGSTIIA